jgi:acylphosphatase
LNDYVCTRFFVAGRVQGVWFRASTVKQAVSLGLTGWAANLADGRVEVMAIGPADQVAVLGNWLKVGPTLARVESVVAQSEDPASVGQINGFVTR